MFVRLFHVGYPNMLVLIDGPINSGKTTVSKCLAEILGKCVVIECDHLRHFADCLPLDRSIPYTLADAGSLAVKWLQRQFSVIINYPISPNELHYIEDSIPKGIAIYRFSLQPRIDVCRSQRGVRTLESREITRIAEMYDARRREGVIGNVIDNSEMTDRECAALIFEEIANKSLQQTRLRRATEL